MNITQSVWTLPEAENLITAFLTIDTPELMRLFLRDIMTEKEITELSKRLKAAKMLIDSAKYTDVAQETGLSSRTIARISDWIKKDTGGYREVIANLDAHHSHIPPVRV